MGGVKVRKQRVGGSLGGIAVLLIVLLSVFACGSESDSDGGNGTGDTDSEVTQGDSIPGETDSMSDVAETDAEVDETTEPELEIVEVAEEVAEVSPGETEVADTGPDLPPAVIPDPPEIVAGQHCTPAGQGIQAVYDIKDPSCPNHPYPVPTSNPGIPVELEGLVVTANFVVDKTDGMFVQDPMGGPYSGVAIFKGSKLLDEIQVGDLVDVKGSLTDYFGQLQISLEGDGTVEKVGSAGAEPEPFDISHPSHVASDGPVAEAFNGMLIRVQDLTVVDTRPDCPHDWGEFLVRGDPEAPGTYGLRVDDMGDWSEYEPEVGDTISAITGPLAYAFENHKIEPRTDADIEVSTKGQGGQTKCVNTGCLVVEYDADGEPFPAAESGALVIGEIMYNAWGSDVDREWFELYNPMGTAVDLTGWTIQDCAVQPQYSIALEGTVDPYDVMVLGSESNYADNGGVPVDLEYGLTFPLPNTVGTLVMFDALGNLVDQVEYSRFGDWPFQTGHSIQLDHPESDNTKPGSWSVSNDEYGDGTNYGTPGYTP